MVLFLTGWLSDWSGRTPKIPIICETIPKEIITMD